MVENPNALDVFNPSVCALSKYSLLTSRELNKVKSPAINSLARYSMVRDRRSPKEEIIDILTAANKVANNNKRFSFDRKSLRQCLNDKTIN